MFEVMFDAEGDLGEEAISLIFGIVGGATPTA
jgi:hypothetical protein